MAEGSKVRLVRCPKCENLLPELPDFPVYQCGGCGAVLQVKNKSISTDGSSSTGKSVEEQQRVVVKLGSEKSESDRETEGLEEIRKKRREGLRTDNSNSSSSSRTEDRELTASDGLAAVAAPLRQNRRIIEQEPSFGTKYRRPCKAPVDNWINGDNGDNCEMNLGEDDLGRVNLEKEIGEIKPQISLGNGHRRSQQIPDWKPRDQVTMGTLYRRNPRNVGEGVRFSTSQYPDEGPSNHLNQGSNYGYVDPMKNLNNLDGPDRVESLEQDRAELLKKLEELKDQLSRSRDLGDKSKERVPMDGRMVPPDPYGGHDGWIPERSYGSNGASLHPSMAGKQVRRPLYFNNHGHEPTVPLMNRHDMDVHSFYPPMNASNEIPGYGDLFGPQPARAQNQPFHRYPPQGPQHHAHDYYYRPYNMDAHHDPVRYPHNTFFHQPACSCVHCYEKHWQVPAQVPPAIPPAVLQNRRFADVPTNNPMFYHGENLGAFGPQGYNPTVLNPPPPLHSHEPPPPRIRRPSDIDAEMGSLGWGGSAQRAGIGKRNGRHFRPIAGGAPFIACCNCFELLQLPKKLLLLEKNCQKLRCGACSTINSILLEDKNLIVSVSAQAKEIPLEFNNGSAEVAVASSLHPRDRVNRVSLNSLSDDYDHSGYNFQALDSDPAMPQTEQKVNLSESQKDQAVLSSSSCVSEDEESPETPERPIPQREASNSEELNQKANMTPPLPGSPLREHFDYSTVQQLASKFGKGNRSKRTDKDDVAVTKSTSRQNSVKDAPAATEMEVSFSEYSNTGMSQDSGEVTKEEDRPKMNKGSDSFFAGLIKKSFKDFSKSNQTVEDGRSSVSINGHPIPERLVKKAEKQAGPVRQGQYWYDYRAGFWGMMGQPCLGIIPPYIDEFNYPMPENCAGGNTGVYVNGRELHQKDLNLLSSRGLPITINKSYSVEISGKVFDADTGEELDSLGKLAPTVERVGRGFGMRVPKVNA